MALLADRLVAPLAVFGLAYFAALSILSRFIVYFQWAALASVVVATSIVVLAWEKRRWALGFFISPPLALKEAAGGLAFAVLLIGSADLAIMATTGLHHSVDGRFPALEIVAVFLPAVFHEELLFRGYPFQKLWHWRPVPSTIGVSLVFAAVHGANTAVTPVGLLNIFLGGLVLSLAWAWFERLWFPIGLHLGWNLMSGPVLGYEVSGYAPAASLLDVSGTGPPLMTGGAFGIEGSLWMTVMESIAIAVLVVMVRRKKRRAEIPHSSIRYEEP